MNTGKYANCEAWLAPVRLFDPEFAEGVEKIHYAICMADDIADRAIHPKEAPDLLWLAIQGMSKIVNSNYAERIKNVLERILKSEIANLNFIPGTTLIEDDLKVWKTRASLLDLYFEAWCCIDPSIDTVENWEWFEEFKKYVLVLDDCEDIESGSFEDLIQCRRNYIILKSFGYEGYIDWKNKKDRIVEAMRSIKEKTFIENPQDKRLTIFMRG